MTLFSLLLAASAVQSAPVSTTLASAESVQTAAAARATASTGDPRFNVRLQYRTGDKRQPLSFELVSGHIFFRAKLGDREVWAMLDNRSEHSLIDTSLITPLGLSTETREGKTIRTPTGSLPYSVAFEVPLFIPGQLETKMPMAAMDLRPLAQIAHHPVDMVLGGDVLGHSVFAIDPGRMTIQLFPAGARFNGPVQPVTLPSTRPQLDLTIAGKPVRLTVDLGFGGMLSLTPEAWARVRPTDAKMETRFISHGEGQVYAIDHGVVPQIEINGIQRKDVGVDISPAFPEDGDGTIGMGIFGQFVTVLDTLGAKIWLIPRLPSTPSTPSAASTPATSAKASQP